MIACNICIFSKDAGRNEQYICYCPEYPKGKIIYQETFRVLKHVGCFTGVETK